MKNIISDWYSSLVTVEFMAIDTAKDDSLSVDAHEAVLHFKFPEADRLMNHFLNNAISILYGYMQVI